MIARPRRYRADTVARALNVTYAERQRLGLTTIGAIDVSASGRALLRKRRSKKRKADARRAKGAVPRAVYEAESAEHTRPWEPLGISRRTFYRRKAAKNRVAKLRGTSAGTANSSLNAAAIPVPSPSLTHDTRSLRLTIGPIFLPTEH